MAGEIVGREAELASLDRFLDAVPEGPVALVLEGEPGIGKTTLWRATIAAARGRSYTVLTSQPAESETKLSFAALFDLLNESVDEVGPALPAPQRRALEVALLRAESDRGRPAPGALPLAVLGVLHALAGKAPTVVAIDDVQSLDPPTARVLQFAIRRLGSERIGLLVSQRSGTDRVPLDVGRAVPEDRLHRLGLGPLELDALGRILGTRLDVEPGRPLLVRLHEASGGNPFYALEIARDLGHRGLLGAPGDTLPMPESLKGLVRERLAGLPARTREILLAAAALVDPTLVLVRSAVGSRFSEAALQKAVDADVAEIDDDTLRFSHPVLRSALYWGEPPSRRRSLHRRLARVVSDPEERARHFALGATGPDAEVAEALDEAGERARSRGASDAAAELFELARRLTPGGRREEIRRRILEAGRAWFEAGDAPRGAALLEEAVRASPEGPAQAEAVYQLGMVRAAERSWREAAGLFERALPQAGDDPAVRRALEQGIGYARLFMGDVEDALVHARAALRIAEALDDQGSLVEALSALAFLEFVLGGGLPSHRMERALAVDDPDTGLPAVLTIVVRPPFAFAQMLYYAGEFDASRSIFESLLREAPERGEESVIPVLHYHLAELECWAGRWQKAARHARASLQAALQQGTAFHRTLGHYAAALVDAHRGLVDSARRQAENGLSLAEETGVVFAEILNLSVLGFLELSRGNSAQADEHLSRALGLRAAMGVREPAYLRAVPDEVEALVGLGELDRAESVLEPFEEDGRRLGRGWSVATAGRCRGLLSAARGDPESAIRSLEAALAEHEGLGEPFELARTLLVLGQARRRAKQKRAARDALDRALEIFEMLGAPQWVEKAKADLARIGGRAPASLALTETEARVAELAATGRTNREVADALFMSVHTVEWNLSKVFRKLGVRSRTELAARLPDLPPGP